MGDPNAPLLHRRRVLEALVRHEVAFILVGGQAARLHGAQRPTSDLDIVVEWTVENLDRIGRTLVELEAGLRVEGVDHPIAVPHRDGRFLAKLELSTWRSPLGDLDLLGSLPAPGADLSFEDLRSRAAPFVIDGLEVFVASLDDVITSKQTTDRPSDRAALPELIRLRDRTSRAWWCDECGEPTIGTVVHGGHPPVCAAHGPRWRLVRNAPAAGTVIVRDGRILLARRAKEPYAGWWEVPGGFVELGEHPVDAAIREVREELGIDIELTGLVGIYLEVSGFGEQLQVTVYEATTEAEACVPDPTEVSEWAWFDPADVPAELAGRHRIRVDDWIAGRTVPLPADGR